MTSEGKEERIQKVKNTTCAQPHITIQQYFEILLNARCEKFSTEKFARIIQIYSIS